jgi:hypothetical protein
MKIMGTQTEKTIASYDSGESAEAKSPVMMEELEELKQTVTLTDDDIMYLHMAGYTFENQTEDIINTWRAVIAASPHLAYYFTAYNNEPNERYKALLKERFKQWVLDVCFMPYDQDWLNNQQKIGLRYTDSRSHIPLRYILAFTAVINNTIRPFLANKVKNLDELEKMHQAWCKAVILHVTVWSRAYVPANEW